jgi:hypothetical protein
MNWTKVSAIAEILSSVAVLATLVYLAIQTQQNTTAIQADVRQGLVASTQAILLYASSNPEIDEFYYKPELTDGEKRRLSTFLLTLATNFETYWLQYQNGSLDERTWRAQLGAIVGTFSAPRTRTWWKNAVAQGTAGLDPEFVAEIDKRLEATPILDYQLHLDAFN